MADGDRLVDVVGVLLVVGVVAGVGILLVFGIGGTADRATGVPDANWSVEQTNRTHVRITHTGGEPVDAANLVVTVEDSQRPVSWSKTLFEGDSGVVEARDGQRVRLYWQETPRGTRHLLGTWQHT